MAIEYRDHTAAGKDSGSPLAMPYPDNEDGDLLVCALFGSSNINMPTPTGWTAGGGRFSSTNGSPEFQVLYRRVTSTLSGSFDVVDNEAGEMAAVCWSLSGALATGSPYRQGSSQYGTFASAASATISTGDTTSFGDNINALPGDYVLALFAIRAAGSMSFTYNSDGTYRGVQGTSDVDVAFADREVTTSGAVPSLSGTSSITPTNNNLGAQIVIAAAPPATDFLPFFMNP